MIKHNEAILYYYINKWFILTCFIFSNFRLNSAPPVTRALNWHVPPLAEDGGDSWAPPAPPTSPSGSSTGAHPPWRLSGNFPRAAKTEAWRAPRPPGGADVADEMFRQSRVISQPAVCPTGREFGAAAGRFRSERNLQSCRDRTAWHGGVQCDSIMT